MMVHDIQEKCHTVPFQFRFLSLIPLTFKNLLHGGILYAVVFRSFPNTCGVRNSWIQEQSFAPNARSISSTMRAWE